MKQRQITLNQVVKFFKKCFLKSCINDQDNVIIEDVKITMVNIHKKIDKKMANDKIIKINSKIMCEYYK